LHCGKSRLRSVDKQRDEVPAFHNLMPLVLPAEKIAHLGTTGTAALRDFNPAYDGFGSSSEILTLSKSFPLFPSGS
jgi:hypothetical protein